MSAHGYKKKATPFQEASGHELFYGLQINARDPTTGEATRVMCRFCQVFGREATKPRGSGRHKEVPATRKRGLITSVKFFKAPFLTDNYRSHLEGQHPRKWSAYQVLSLEGKKKYFDVNGNSERCAKLPRSSVDENSNRVALSQLSEDRSSVDHRVSTAVASPLASVEPTRAKGQLISLFARERAAVPKQPSDQSNNEEAAADREKQRNIESLDQAIANFIIETSLPSQMVELPAFKHMMEQFRPRYQCPNSKDVRRRVLECYADLIPQLKRLIHDLEVKYTLTISHDEEEIRNGFWIVTMHWNEIKSRSFKTKSIVLHAFRPDNVVRGMSAGTGESAGTYLFNFLKSLGPSTLSKLCAVVARRLTASGQVSHAYDAGRTLISLVTRELKQNPQAGVNIACFESSMQTVADAIIAPCVNAIGKLRIVLQLIGTTSDRRQGYREVAKRAGDQIIEPPRIEPCGPSAKWQETIKMMASGVERKRLIQEATERLFSGEDDLETGLSERDWMQLSDTIKILQPIVEIMNEAEQAEKEYSTLSLLGGQIQVITEHFHALTENPLQHPGGMGSFLTRSAALGLTALEQARDSLTGDLARCASFLDVRLPKPVASSAEAIETRQLVRNLLKRDYGYQSQFVEPPGQQKASASSLRARLFQKTANSTGAESRREADEVDRFAFHLEPEDTSLLRWWNAHKHVYPTLYRLALDILAIPSSASRAVQIASAGAALAYRPGTLSASFGGYSCSSGSDGGIFYLASVCSASWQRAGILSTDIDKARGRPQDLLEDWMRAEDCFENEGTQQGVERKGNARGAELVADV